MVWQTQALGTTDIFGRWFSGSKAITSDIHSWNTYQKDQQITPSLGCFAGRGRDRDLGQLWEDGSYWGVFARKFNAKGSGGFREGISSQPVFVGEPAPNPAAVAGR